MRCRRCGVNDSSAAAGDRMWRSKGTDCAG